jgi:hypothetical protein
MRSLLVLLWPAVLAAAPSSAALVAERSPAGITIKGHHFALTIGAQHGGELSELRLYDGSNWNLVWSAPAITFPRVVLCDADHEYALADATDARVSDLTGTHDKISVRVSAVPRAPDGAAGPWQITLCYEVYAEGAVLIDLDCEQKETALPLTQCNVSFAVGEAIRKGPQCRQNYCTTAGAGFPIARTAFGLNPARSFTNEIEVTVEDRKAICGTTGFQLNDGRFTWTLAAANPGQAAPAHYHNRIVLGLGAAVGGPPESNVIGQRVYHWVNWIDTRTWYPTNEQIDTMAARNATMLILHHEWMQQRGSNGHPHADYRVARAPNDLSRTIAYAHGKGMRVGLYMRGVERYALAAGFFEKYCRRDWDGIYVDWHGAAATAYHERKYAPERDKGDEHFTPDGTRVPAGEYFLFTRRLRAIVGPRGFLIGHCSMFNSGVTCNLCFDASLPGETNSDWEMLKDRDSAVYKGMMGGCVCMPWTLDSAAYRSAEGAAKMAGWGLYPHIVLGLKPPRTKYFCSCEADDPTHAWVLPYWRLLAQVDVDGLSVFNLPSQGATAVKPSRPDFASIVYRTPAGVYLLITASLGDAPAAAELTLDPKALGMRGEYRAVRIDSASGASRPCRFDGNIITTSKLPRWGIEGFRIYKE